MKKLKSSFLIFLSTIMMLTALTGCGSSKSSSKSPSTSPSESSSSSPSSSTSQSVTPTPTPISLTISAAASLKDSMEEIKALYNKEKPNVTININYGASGALAQQIEQGANVDIFFSAAEKQMSTLAKKDLIIKNTNKDMLGNKVVLIIKSDSLLKIKDFKDCATDKVKKLALGEPKSVPAGQYAEQIYKKLNILNAVKTKAVYGKDVKEVLNWVESGNADAGVVYYTDAKTSKEVKIVATASKDQLATPVTYPAAVIKSSKNQAGAMEFLKFLSDKKAKTVFKKYGFEFLGK